MGEARTYILSVVAAAILCCILTRLTGTKGGIGTLFHLLCGLFLAFTVIRPITSVKTGDLAGIVSDVETFGEKYAASGSTESRNALSEIIKQETEAYILDKAQAMDAVLLVDVQLDDGTPPVPEGVYLQGTVSSHAKERLQTIIESELGIKKERQIWIE